MRPPIHFRLPVSGNSQVSIQRPKLSTSQQFNPPATSKSKKLEVSQASNLSTVQRSINRGARPIASRGTSPRNTIPRSATNSAKGNSCRGDSRNYNPLSRASFKPRSFSPDPSISIYAQLSKPTPPKSARLVPVDISSLVRPRLPSHPGIPNLISKTPPPSISQRKQSNPSYQRENSLSAKGPFNFSSLIRPRLSHLPKKPEKEKEVRLFVNNFINIRIGCCEPSINRRSSKPSQKVSKKVEKTEKTEKFEKIEKKKTLSQLSNPKRPFTKSKFAIPINIPPKTSRFGPKIVFDRFHTQVNTHRQESSSPDVRRKNKRLKTEMDKDPEDRKSQSFQDLSVVSYKPENSPHIVDLQEFEDSAIDNQDQNESKNSIKAEWNLQTSQPPHPSSRREENTYSEPYSEEEAYLSKLQVRLQCSEVKENPVNFDPPQPSLEEGELFLTFQIPKARSEDEEKSPTLQPPHFLHSKAQMYPFKNTLPGVVKPTTSVPLSPSSAAKNQLLNFSPSQPPSIFDYYIISELIGEGSYARVYKGRSRNRHQSVAIKRFEKSKIKSPAALERIRSELSLLSSLRHPNIIEFIELFETRAHIFLIMELAEGGDLQSQVFKTKGLSEAQYLPILSQILSGLLYLEEKKILHRDLKLDNILLSKNKVKIADFGVSVGGIEKKTVLYECIGTPMYLAPEMVSGNGYKGFKSDIWALGVMSYIAVFFCEPFDSSDVKNLAEKIVSDPIRLPKNAQPSPKFLKALMGMLEKDPEKRMGPREVAQTLGFEEVRC